MSKGPLFIFLILVLLHANESHACFPFIGDKATKGNTAISADSISLRIYEALNCPSLDFRAFAQAMHGYKLVHNQQKIGKPDIITLIDFSQSSKNRRLYIIDLLNRKIIHQSYVAHGRNSGWDIPDKFSNRLNSYQSSLGFFLTGETYTGKHGLSLRLDGLEADINHNARQRNIVIHSADYATKDFIKKAGRLGRSFGCPALPNDKYDEVIELIKNKSLIYIYAGKADYIHASSFFDDRSVE